MGGTGREFQGIWIPKEIWLSSTLSLMERVLFVEIHSLDNERGCFASNKYFADFFGVSARQIRRYLLSLKEKRLITITICNDIDRVMRAAGKHTPLKHGILTEHGRMFSRESNRRDFKGVWIPKEIWLSPELVLMEKVLFAEIQSLDNERGCYAFNRHFADFFGMSDRQIRRHLASLKEKGFITITILDDTDRVMRAAGKYARVKESQLRELRQMSASLVECLSLHRPKLSTARSGTPDRNVHGGRT